MSECLSENALLDWHLGTLAPRELAHLEHHLDACEACRQVVESLTSKAAPRPAEATLRSQAGDPAQLPKGATVGRYVVVAVMGMGGMGVVYAAFDPLLDRKVALKLLHVGAAREDTGHLQDAIRREAQAMARLSHPNVVTVFDVGMAAGQLFIAMELIEGTTLATWLRDTKRRATEVVRHLVAAGRGLEAAHAAGFVHRDFKPANVLLGQAGRVCVTDFGLARLVTESGPGSLTVPDRPGTPERSTTHGGIVGTPVYMSPEQLRGANADERSDQFSFCVTLYEALYGERPFQGERVEELTASVLSGTVRPAPRSAKVPQWLRRVLLRGLRPAPQERYPSMAALLGELGRDPAARWRRAGIGAASATLVLVAGFGLARGARQQQRMCTEGAGRLGGVWDPSIKSAIHASFSRTGNAYAELAWREVESTLDGFTKKWVSAYDDACRATHVRRDQSAELLDLRMHCFNRRLGETAALTELFTHADSRLVDNAVQAAQGGDALSACADVRALHEGRKPPADPAQRAVYDDLERKVQTLSAMFNAGRYLEAKGAIDAAVEQARRLAHPLLLSDVLRYQSNVFRNSGQLDAAQRVLHEAAVDGLLGGDDGRAAKAWDDLAVVEADLSRLDDANDWLEYAGAAKERAGDSPFLSARHLGSVARIAERMGKNLDAASAHKQAAELYRQSGREFFAMQSLEYAGSALVSAGQLDEANKLCTETLAWFEGHVGPDTIWASGALDCLAAVATERGRPEDVLALRRRIVALSDAVYGSKGAWCALAYTGLGFALLDGGDVHEAQRAADQAERLSEEGQSPGEVLEPLGDLKAKLFLEQGRASDAAALLEPRVALLRGQRPGDVTSIEFDLARALWTVGKDRSRALRLAEEARATASSLSTISRQRELADTIGAWLRARQPAPAAGR